MRQISRRKSSWITYIWELHKTRRPKSKLDNWRLYITWEKERGIGVWDFKGKEGNLQEDERVQMFGKQKFAGAMQR